MNEYIARECLGNPKRIHSAFLWSHTAQGNDFWWKEYYIRVCYGLPLSPEAISILKSYLPEYQQKEIEWE